MSSEVLQQLDFSQGSFCKDLFAEDIRDFFDGDAFAILAVGRSAVDIQVSLVFNVYGLHTRQFHKRPVPTLSSQCIFHQL
jgi:hypothetical protein